MKTVILSILLMGLFIHNSLSLGTDELSLIPLSAEVNPSSNIICPPTDDPQPDTLFNDDGTPYWYTATPSLMWCAAKFVPDSAFTLRSVYFMVGNEHLYPAPCQVFVYSDNGHNAPGPIIAGSQINVPTPLPDMTWIDANFPSELNFSEGEKFHIIYGPAPNNPTGYYALLDASATPEANHYSLGSQPTTWNLMTVGDFMIRAGGEYTFLPPSVMAVSLDTVNYDSFAFGDTVYQDLTIYNVSDSEELNITHIIIDPIQQCYFNLAGFTPNTFIAVGDSLCLTLSLTSYNEGLIQTNMRIYNNATAPLPYQIPITGECVYFIPLHITLTPLNPPIHIPAGGGFFRFTLLIRNNSQGTLTFDGWTEIIDPHQHSYFRLYNDLVVGPGNCIFNIITQEVPARMPSGSYTYFGYIGYYPDSTMNYDYFNFYKSPGNALSTDFIDWNISAWEAQNFNPLDNDPEFHFVTASPNPFNSGITVNFDIQSASVVELVIFNLLGEKVAVLAEGVYEQGLYSLKWDASNFPSGVYFYQVIIQAQDNSPKFQKVSKIVLMK